MEILSKHMQALLLIEVEKQINNGIVATIEKSNLSNEEFEASLNVELDKRMNLFCSDAVTLDREMKVDYMYHGISVANRVIVKVNDEIIDDSTYQFPN